MAIDKLLEELKEAEDSTRMSESISEKCWQNIKKDIRIKQRWYDKLFIKVHNANRKYRLKVVVQLALAVFIISSMPTIIKETKFYVEKSAFFNKLKLNDPNDNKINKDNKFDERPEYKETDENYLKALEKVREIAQKRYSRFSLYSTGQLEKYQEDSYYIITIYENTVGSKVPEISDILRVNAESFEVDLPYAYDSINIDKYFSLKSDLYKNEIRMESLVLLINKADNINIESYDDVYSSIDLYSNLKGKLKKTNSSIPEYAYCYKEQPNIYYMYDKKEESLYRYNTVNDEKKLIYKYKPKEYSILTLERKADIDGDGKEDEIKFDPLRGILSINDVSIYVSYGRSFKDLMIVDIDNKHAGKEIYIGYESANDYSNHNIYTYNGGSITQLIAQDGTPVIDGSGKVIFKDVLSQLFQTHSSDLEYVYYNDNSLRLTNKELYDAKNIEGNNGTSSYQIIKCKKELKIYKYKNSKEMAAVLKVGESIKVIGYDEKNWVLVENSQGVRGWFEVNFSTVKELNLHSGDVFEGLIFAG
jgi:hypothetical protein